MDDTHLATRHQDAAGRFEQADGILDVQDGEQHRVIDARIGPTGAVSDEIPQLDRHDFEALNPGLSPVIVAISGWDEDAGRCDRRPGP